MLDAETQPHILRNSTRVRRPCRVYKYLYSGPLPTTTTGSLLTAGVPLEAAPRPERRLLQIHAGSRLLIALVRRRPSTLHTKINQLFPVPLLGTRHSIKGLILHVHGQ